MGTKVKQYTAGEVRRLLKEEGLGFENASYLAPLSEYGRVMTDANGEEQLMGIPTRSALVFEVRQGVTGVHTKGTRPIIILNVNDTLDYDRVSEIHPTPDATVYVWSSSAWEDMRPQAADLGLYREWYRSDVYKDPMTPFNGQTLGWEDLPPAKLRM